jgi:hypothetical protein
MVFKTASERKTADFTIKKKFVGKLIDIILIPFSDENLLGDLHPNRVAVALSGAFVGFIDQMFYNGTIVGYCYQTKMHEIKLDTIPDNIFRMVLKDTKWFNLKDVKYANDKDEIESEESMSTSSGMSNSLAD